MKKNILKYICILSLIFCFFPLPVSADSTYTVINNGACLNLITTSGHYQYFSIRNAQSEVRSVVIINGTIAYFFYVSLSSFERSSVSNSYSCSTSYSNSTTRVLDGVTYYFSYYSFTNSGATSWDYIAPKFSSLDSVSSQYRQTDSAIYYTFGDGAVTPIEPINWGKLDNIRYETSVSGSGFDNEGVGANNILDSRDWIFWNPDYDTLGNSFSAVEDPGMLAEIRVCIGKFTALTLDAMYGAMGDTDFDDSGNYVLGSYPVDLGSRGVYFSWEEIVNHAQPFFDTPRWLFGPYVDPANLQYVLRGWYYEIRLINNDRSYEGTWQRLYTPLSASGSANNAVTTNNNVTNNVINAFEQTLTMNNTENNTYNSSVTNYFYDTPVVTQDPNIDIPDYTDVLTLMKDTMFKILNGIVNMPQNIISGFSEAVTFNFVDELPEQEELEDAVLDELNNTYYGDLITALSRFKDTFNDNRNYVGSSSDSGMIIIPDLGFDWAGEHVTIVESQVFNLYNWVASDPDMFTAYNLYLNIVDGIIYISMFRMLFKRMLGSLDKGGS